MAVDFIGDGLALRSKGDILTHDGTAPIAIAAGTNGQILSAQSSATSGLVWITPDTSITNNDFVLISSSRLTATASSIEFSSITQGYRDLMIIFQGRDNYNAPASYLGIRINGDTVATGGKYTLPFSYYASSTVSHSGGDADSSILIRGALTGSTANTGEFGIGWFYIPHYTSSSKRKSLKGYAGIGRNDASAFCTLIGGTTTITSAITSIQLIVYTGTLFQIGTYAALYGVK